MKRSLFLALLAFFFTAGMLGSYQSVHADGSCQEAVACSSDTDCQSDEICEGTITSFCNGTCVIRNDADRGSGGNCSADACTNSADCSANFFQKNCNNPTGGSCSGECQVSSAEQGGDSGGGESLPGQGAGGTSGSSGSSGGGIGSGSSGSGGINTQIIAKYGAGVQSVINDVLVPVLIAIAFIVFLWGVFKYFILGADDEESRTTGRSFVLWGIIGLVVIFSVWGLVNLVGNTIGISPGGTHAAYPKL